MYTLRQDFLRFAKLHSWYKHIPLEGMDFYMYRDVGQQPRNGIHAEVDDARGLHWYFSTEKPRGIRSHKVRFGPFLRGVEGYGVRGFHIIVGDAGEAEFQTWLSREYPEMAATKWSDAEVKQLFVAEQNKYWESVKAAAVEERREERRDDQKLNEGANT
jgi:hypothetical protein